MAATDYDAIIAALSGGGGAGAQQAGQPAPVLGGRTATRNVGTRTTGSQATNGSPTANDRVILSPYGELGGGYTADDVNAILRGLPPERIAAVQRQMQTLGLLPKNFTSFGFTDKTTRSAFEEVLTVANDRDISYTKTLDGLVATQQETGESAIEQARMDIARKRQQTALSFNTALNTYEKSDPASVRQTAEQAFQQALGRKPKKAELDTFVNGFLSRERGSQEQVFGARDRLEGQQRGRAMTSLDIEEAALDDQAGGSESEELQRRLDKLIAASPYKIGKGAPTRSYEEQVRLYNNYKAGKGPLAAKPGTSKHGDGRANDLKYSSPKARQWILENAEQFGLHLPLYDPKKPRSRDESWHVELKGGHTRSDGHDHGPATAAPAPISENITVQRQDLGAQAVEYARKVNPTETAAYDIGGQFQSMLQILSKSVV